LETGDSAVECSVSQSIGAVACEALQRPGPKMNLNWVTTIASNEKLFLHLKFRLKKASLLAYKFLDARYLFRDVNRSRLKSFCWGEWEDAGRY
jgi:hypothetical protein